MSNARWKSAEEDEDKTDVVLVLLDSLAENLGSLMRYLVNNFRLVRGWNRSQSMGVQTDKAISGVSWLFDLTLILILIFTFQNKRKKYSYFTFFLVPFLLYWWTKTNCFLVFTCVSGICWVVSYWNINIMFLNQNKTMFVSWCIVRMLYQN